jgi:hypothetical protein
MRRPGRIRLALAALVLGAAAGFAAEPPAPPLSVGWHVVAPGETLEGITERYLGDPNRWPENHKLNPGIQNPHKLTPGQRIRILLPAPRAAELKKLERKVETKPDPQPWSPAHVGARLKERDGIRTFQQSSAELAFDDGGSLVLNENSLVFLRETELRETRVKRDTLEVIEGEADLAVRAAPKGHGREIEIVMGNSKASQKSGAEGAQTRARLAKAGDAQLMVYRGQTDVEAAGKRVAVAKGMGTSVPKDGPPREPEKLLAAPGTGGPLTFDYANPRLTWKPVEGATAYTVEVCRDASCGQLLARATSLKETAWSAEPLPAGEHRWRVTAVSASGLDGYASEAAPLTIRSERADLEPPAVVAVPLGGTGASATEEGLEIGPDGRVALEARDDVSGVAWIRYRWDGGAWQTYDGGPLSPPDGASHRLDFEATDHAGRTSRTHSLKLERKG